MPKRIPRRSKRLVWAAAAVTAAVAALTVTQAFASAPSNTVYACVANESGAVRIVAQGTACRHDEYARSWSVTGPQGATGTTGPAGPQGPAGAAAASSTTPRTKVVGSVTLTPATGDTTPITFDIYDFSSQVQQTGSQSSGAGAGKVTFQPITMTKLPDAASPQLLDMLGSGDQFSSAEVKLYGKDGTVAETFDYQLAALASMTTTNSGAPADSLFEQLTLEVGAITANVGSSSGGWNRVTNTSS